MLKGRSPPTLPLSVLPNGQRYAGPLCTRVRFVTFPGPTGILVVRRSVRADSGQAVGFEAATFARFPIAVRRRSLTYGKNRAGSQIYRENPAGSLIYNNTRQARGPDVQKDYPMRFVLVCSLALVLAFAVRSAGTADEAKEAKDAKATKADAKVPQGGLPKGADGKPLNLDFETGNLR